MKKLFAVTAIAVSFTFVGCGTMGTAGSYFSPETTSLAAPSALKSPMVLEDNSGAFMSPYTSDEVLAEWVDNAIKAKAGAAVGGAIGSAVGQYAMSEALEGFGMFGSLIGDSVGKKLGRDQALKAAGGMEFIKETSDLSFNQWQDLAVFMYVNYSTNEDYNDVLAATQTIYPELQGYTTAIRQASRNVQ